jgi:hypothetical protein
MFPLNNHQVGESQRHYENYGLNVKYDAITVINNEFVDEFSK